MDSETELLDSYNEGLYKELLTPGRKWYNLRNPTNTNYSNKRSTWRSMVWNNLIFGSNEFHSVTKLCINVVNDIVTFVKPTPPTNIITNETILTQYSIN